MDTPNASKGYSVLLRRNADGKTRWCYYPYEYSAFIWEDGNWSCDCNRELDFYRAQNEPPPEHIPANICIGEGRYDVVELVLGEDRSRQ